MITLKTRKELLAMREAGRISAQALRTAGQHIRAGMTTKELDRILYDFIRSKGATPSFLGYGGFPGTACISVNNEVIHGIPGPRKLREGDIVSIDVGALYKGFHGDNAYTFAVGKISAENEQLLRETQAAGASRRPSPARASAISALPYRAMWSKTALPWCASMWDTAWAGICTNPRRSPTLGKRAGACG